MEATSTAAANLTDRERTLLGTALNERIVSLLDRNGRPEVIAEYEDLLKKLGL